MNKFFLWVFLIFVALHFPIHIYILAFDSILWWKNCNFFGYIFGLSLLRLSTLILHLLDTLSGIRSPDFFGQCIPPDNVITIRKNEKNLRKIWEQFERIQEKFETNSGKITCPLFFDPERDLTDIIFGCEHALHLTWACLQIGIFCTFAAFPPSGTHFAFPSTTEHVNWVM